jgi:signal transduction histidine kinase
MTNARGRELAGLADDEPLPTRADWSGARGVRPDGTPYTPQTWPIARALRGERVARERVNLFGQDGRRRTHQVAAAPIVDASGNVVAAVVMVQDVTDAEMRRRAAGDFVANAAHELRTPLAAIVSGVDVLQAGAKEIPEERDRFLAHVGREAARLTRLTTALLLLARLESGIETARAEIVQLAPLLSTVAASLRPAAGVRVSVRCPSDAAAVASPELLEQALTSVAHNAARYTSDGMIAISVANPDGRVRIRVHDTGRGMDAETLAHAGERFYRGDPTGLSGFGLGLAIARASVEAMGGSLAFASEVGAGTIVDVLLPSAQVMEP